MSEKDEEECLKIIRKENYYDILGIPKTAKSDEIRKAYKKLAIKFHPDKNKAKSAEEAFKKVSQAFSVLSDEQKRKNYDMFGKEDIGGGFNSNVDPFDIFNMFFGGGFGPMNNMGGNTTFKFSKGNGSFTVFSSGDGFPGMFMNQGFRRRHNNNDNDSDDNFNPFEELFGFNHFRRNRNNNNSNTHDSRHNADLQNSLKNLSLCLNLFPLICCLLIFFILPPFLRL